MCSPSRCMQLPIAGGWHGAAWKRNELEGDSLRQRAAACDTRASFPSLAVASLFSRAKGSLQGLSQSASRQQQCTRNRA